VALEHRDDPAALQMLRAVAGRGLSLRSFGAGRALERHGRALAKALVTAGRVVSSSKTGDSLD